MPSPGKCTASWLAVVAAAPLWALAEDAERAQRIEPIDNVTIIGRRIEPEDVAGSAHVIDAEALELFLESDILRVLRSVPGVYLQEEEGFGLRPNIGIRGSGLDRSARIALLEDGVLIAPAPYAAPAAYYFPTQRRMHALEVLKGPAAIVVGPRTTGGAINMISTPIPAEGGGQIDARLGDFGTSDAHLQYGIRGERLSWLIETVQSSSDGFKHIEGPTGGDTGYDLEDYVAKLQLDSRPGARVYQSLRFKVGYAEQQADETYLGLTDADFAVDPESRYAASAGDVFNSEHHQYQANYTFDPGGSWRAEATVYRNDFHRNWYKLQSVAGSSISSIVESPDEFASELGWLKGSTSPDDAISKRANNRDYFSEGLQASVEWDTAIRDTDILLHAGLRLHEDEEDRFQHEDAYRMHDGELVLTFAAPAGSKTNRVSSASARSIFIDSEIHTGRWILTPGVRLENVDMRRLDFSTADPRRTQGPERVRKNSVSTIIPGAGALYRVSDAWRLLAGVHRGYNPPAPGSSAAEETSINIEAGTRYDGDRFDLEAIFFVNDYNNLVGTVTESTGGGGTIGDQFDGGEVRISGLELSGGYEWQMGRFRLPISLEYTWTREAEFRSAFESDFEPWGSVAFGDELPYIPEHQLRTSASLLHARWQLNMAVSYVDTLRTRAGQGPLATREMIDSHVIWDMVARWKVSDRLSSYIKVDNLLDESYAAARRPAGLRPGLPRMAYIGLTYRL